MAYYMAFARFSTFSALDFLRMLKTRFLNSIKLLVMTEVIKTIN